MQRRAFLATAGTALTAVAGCAGAFGTGGLTEDEYDIGMSSVDFLPAEYTVSAGETVVWGNTGSRRHTVTAYENAIPGEAEYFASGGFANQAAAVEAWNGDPYGGAIESGATFEHTFEVPGSYRYFCVPHQPQGMEGTIVVESRG